MKIILASSSIGRKRVLESLGLKFEVIPANIEEEKFTAGSPPALVKNIAKAKALAVLEKVIGGVLPLVSPRALPPANKLGAPSLGLPDSRHPTYYLIIAADSMVVFRGKTYGKPKTKQEAKKYLQMFSGKTHEFLTGLYIINTKNNKIYQNWEKSKVSFEKLTTKEISDYLKVAPVTRFAGAYALEEAGAEILRPKVKVFGSKTNVLGLPVEKLVPILKEEGINIQKSPRG